MRVFLCWSGQASLHIARALHEWLGDTVQELKPFMSSEDIRKGDRWRTEIGASLANTNFGILCLTATNLDARWILFEAGALSKSIEHGRVTAVLHGIKATDVTEPLSQFQHTTLNRDDIKKLLSDLNALLPEDKRLPAARLDRAFDRAWPELEARLKETPSEASPEAKTSRAVPDMINEILELTRNQSRQIERLAMRTKHLELESWIPRYMRHSKEENESIGRLLSRRYKPGEDVRDIEAHLRQIVERQMEERRLHRRLSGTNEPDEAGSDPIPPTPTKPKE